MKAEFNNKMTQINSKIVDIKDEFNNKMTQINSKIDHMKIEVD